MFFPLLVATALADDLDLAITVPHREPVELTFYDVEDGQLPSVSVPGNEPGQSFRVGLGPCIQLHPMGPVRLESSG